MAETQSDLAQTSQALMKRASPQSHLGASAIDVFLADRRVTSPVSGRRVIDEYAIEPRNATSLVIVEVIQSDAVQLSCRCFGRLLPVDVHSPFEEKAGIYQHCSERWTTVP